MASKGPPDSPQKSETVVITLAKRGPRMILKLLGKALAQVELIKYLCLWIDERRNVQVLSRLV